MAVQYNSKDNTWSTWLDIFKKEIPEASEESINAFEKLAKAQAKGYDPTINDRMEKWIRQNKLADETLISFLQDTKYSEKTLANYQLYLKESSQSMTLFQRAGKAAGNAIKSIGAAIGSMAAMWAIGEVISLIVSGLDKLVNSAKYAKEAAEGFSSSYETLQKDISDNSSKISELNAKYQELSEGVNNLGENVSLTKDEYKEYKDVVSQISDIMPDLNTRFNDQGEKIGFVQGKLKDLNSEYDKYQQAQAKKLINDGDDDGNTVSDAFDDYRQQGAFIDSDGKYHYGGNRITTSNRDKIGEITEKIENIKNKDIISDYDKENLERLESKLQKIKNEIDIAVSSVQDALNTFAQANDSFYDLDDKQKSYLQSFLGNIDDEFIQNNGLDNQVHAESFVQNIIDQLQNNTQLKKAWNGLFSLDLNDASMSPEEIQKQVNKFLQIIAEAFGVDDWQSLKIPLGFEIVDENVDSYNNTLNKFKKKATNVNSARDLSDAKSRNTAIDNWANQNKVTEKELENLASQGYDSSTSIDTLTEALEKNRKELDSVAESAKKVTFTDEANALSSLASDIDGVASAYQEFKDSGFSDIGTMSGIADGFKDLDSFKKFEKVAGDSKSSSEDIQKSFNNLVTEYIYTKGALDNLTSSTVGLCETQLKAQGITNANELVTSDYAKAIIYCNENGIDLTNTTWEEVNALMREKDVSVEAQNGLAVLALEKWKSANTTVANLQDISFLEELATKAGIAKNELSELNNAKSALSGKVPGMPTDAAGKYAKQQANKASDKIEKKLSNYKPTGNYSGTKSSSSNNKGSSGKNSGRNSEVKETKEYLDYIEKYLDKVTTKASKAKDKIEELLTFGQKKKQTLNAIKNTEKAIKAEETAAKKYAKFAKKVAANDAKISTKKSKNTKTDKKTGKKTTTYTTKSVNGINSKKVEKYEKLIRNGSLGKDALQTIKNEKLKTVLQDYETWWSKSKACKEQQESLRKTLKELYETLANNPIDSAKDKIEKLSNAYDVLEAKMGNLKNVPTDTINLSNVQSLGNKIIKNYDNQFNADKAAKITTAKNFSKSQKEAKKAFKKVKAKGSGLSSKELETVKKNLKAGKAISNNLVSKIKDTSLYAKVVAFNENLAAKTEAKKTYDKSEQDHVSNVRNAQKEIFDKVAEAYENRITLLKAQEDAISSQIDLIEAKGATVSSDYYNSLIGQESSKKAILEQELASLQSQIATMDVGTDQWYEAKQSIDSVTSSITECDKNIVDYKNNITELANTIHEKLYTELQKVTNEMDFFANLVSSTDLTDDKTGTLTSNGLLTLADYMVGYNEKFVEAEKTKALLDNLQANKSTGNYSFVDVEGNQRDYQSPEQFQEAIDKLYSDWRDQISSTNDYEQKAIDLIKKKYEAELAYLQELINSKKEALQAEKDLYDYQRSIADKSKNIATLQKQITALSGDNSEEGKARVQKLQTSLEEAQQDMKDTQYDKMISDQSDMLDKLYDEYEDLMNKLLKDTNKLIREAVNAVNNNKAEIEATKNALCEKFDYSQEATNGIFNTTSNAVSGLEKIKVALGTGSENNDTSIIGKLASIYNAITSKSNSQTNAATAPPAPSNTPQPDSSKPTPTGSGTGVKAPELLGNQFSNNEIIVHSVTAKEVMTFIKSKASKAKASKVKNGKPVGYKDVNKKIYNLTGGKVLSDSELKDLADFVRVPYDDSSKDGNLYKALKNLGIKGFKTGGIGQLVKESGEDGIAMVRNGEGFISPENVDDIKHLLDVVPDINKFTNSFVDLPKLKPVQNSTIGDVNITLDGSNVIDKDSFIKVMKDPTVKKVVQANTIDLLGAGSRLGANRFK